MGKSTSKAVTPAVWLPHSSTLEMNIPEGKKKKAIRAVVEHLPSVCRGLGLICSEKKSRSEHSRRQEPRDRICREDILACALLS